jgi:hypothetical protein
MSAAVIPEPIAELQHQLDEFLVFGPASSAQSRPLHRLEC